jgi:hypothetical protein
MRAVWFCEAVSTELAAGSSLRSALERAAASVDAGEIALQCRQGAPLELIATMAQADFPEIGEELGALLARAGRIGVGPASLFDEMGDLALAQIQVGNEIATASAAGKAAAFILLALPITALVFTLSKGDLDPFFTQPAQRGAAVIGAILTIAGLVAALATLRTAR